MTYYILKDADGAYFLNTLALTEDGCWSKLEKFEGDRKFYLGKCVKVSLREEELP